MSVCLSFLSGTIGVLVPRRRDGRYKDLCVEKITDVLIMFSKPSACPLVTHDMFPLSVIQSKFLSKKGKIIVHFSKFTDYWIKLD